MWAVPIIPDISRGPTSSTEAEYTVASKEAVWIRKFISRLGVYDTTGALAELIRCLHGHAQSGRNNFNLREENTNRGNLEELRTVMKSSSGVVLEAQQRMATRVSLNPKSGVTCDGSPKVSNSSPLVSPSTTINVPQEVYSIDVTATFRVPLTTVGDFHKLINDIEAGKHDKLLSEMTNDDRMETLDALGTICNSIQANNINSDVIPCKVLHVDDSINLNVDESIIPSDPIVQSVDINTKSTSYVGAAGASAKDQPKVNSNFHILVADPVFDGVNISIPHKIVEKVSTRFEHTLYGYFMGKRMAFLVVEYYARNNWAKHGLKRIMMNSKGFFFFKFDSRAGLEAVLEGEADLVDIVTIGIPSLYGDGFTKETIRVELMMVSKRKVKRRRGKASPSLLMAVSLLVPQLNKNVRYEPKATTSAPNKGVTNVGNTSQSSSMLKTTDNSSKKDNLSMSNSFSALNDEEEDDEEDVENVYDESANLIQNTKAGGSLYFTAVVG
ncbi:hypothetical protein Tco_1238761 [Tanacetum coccineum]